LVNSILIIQPFPYGSELTTEGSSLIAELISLTLPLAGAIKSDTALTASIVP
jgi:hypothetical protein